MRRRLVGIYLQLTLDMKSHSTVLSLLLAAILGTGFISFAAAQNSSTGRRPAGVSATTSPPQNDEQGIDVTTRRVNLPISVLDKKGAPVAGLTKSDFLVLEDKQPQTIESFAIESNNLPLYVGVLMDTSASTKGKLGFEKEAALNFIYTASRLRKDKVAFATFDDEVVLHQDFTEKLDLLDKAITKVKKTGEHTSLYDAVWEFCDQKMRGVSGLRALVIVTDGDDTYSRATLDEAIEIAQSTETLIFAISTKAGFSGVVAGVEAGQVKDSGDKKLERLCQETGGQAFFTGDKLALERAFGRVAKDLRSQYIVSYRPTNEVYDGSERRIEVKLVGKRDGMKVRTRRGYRATRRTTAAQ